MPSERISNSAWWATNDPRCPYHGGTSHARDCFPCQDDSAFWFWVKMAGAIAAGAVLAALIIIVTLPMGETVAGGLIP